MSYEKVIDATLKITRILESQSSDRLTESLNRSISALEKGDDIENTIAFLTSMASSPKGLKDIYVESVSHDEWYRLIYDLMNALNEV